MKNNIQMVMPHISKRVLEAYRCGVLGEHALETEVSHAILMVLQTRQRDNLTIAMDFDICELRLAIIGKLSR